jgi:hypothetical protein
MTSDATQPTATLERSGTDDTGALLARLEVVATRRADAEALNLIRSQPALERQRHGLRTVAAVIRGAKQQVLEHCRLARRDPALDDLADFVTRLSALHPISGSVPGTQDHREYLDAMIEWYKALYGTPCVGRFWAAMEALCGADLKSLPDIRGRLLALLAEVGFSASLPPSLDARVLAAAGKPYLFTDPIDALTVVSYAIQRSVAEGDRTRAAGPLLRDWCRLVATTDLDTPGWLRGVYRARDWVHQAVGTLSAEEIRSGRLCSRQAAQVLALMKLTQTAFVSSRLFVLIYGRKRWLKTSRRLFLRLQRHSFDAPAQTPAAAPAGRVVGTARDVLVTRVQGGLGDLMTMRPGLLELARRRPGARIVFAANRAFFAAFSTDDPIELVDIETADLDYRSFGEWFNLSQCPGGVVEVKQVPNVRTQRIDIFAGALGVKLTDAPTKRLAHIAFANDTAAAADAYLARHAAIEGASIGIQLRSAETYKDCPELIDAARELATHHRVFVFDNRPIETRPGDRFVVANDLSFPVVMAIASKLDLLITPDSALLHLAGANGVPCIGLFGPTDGKLHSTIYPNLRYVDLRASLGCIPCWRNEFIKCKVSGSYESTCMHRLAASAVVSEAERVLAGK